MFAQPRRFGTFLTRLNRFAALIDLGDEQVIAHLPNTGRMTELLVTGHPVVVIERPSLIRKTHYDMVLVQYQGHWVSIDSRLPSQVIYQAMVDGALAPWCGCTRVRREPVYGESRLDLELWRPLGHSEQSEESRRGAAEQRCLVETKSVNLVVDGLALFPDAPTLRGARHLRSLMAAAAAGMDASVVFVIQRPDAFSFSPFDEADPEFGRTLREASMAGVGVHAYRCLVTPEGMSLDRAIAVEL